MFYRCSCVSHANFSGCVLSSLPSSSPYRERVPSTILNTKHIFRVHVSCDEAAERRQRSSRNSRFESIVPTLRLCCCACCAEAVLIKVRPAHSSRERRAALRLMSKLARCYCWRAESFKQLERRRVASRRVGLRHDAARRRTKTQSRARSLFKRFCHRCFQLFQTIFEFARHCRFCFQSC